MCNTCNSSVFSGSGCGCNSCGNSLFNLFGGNSCGCNSCCNNGSNFGFQRICRDCNGNIRVRNSNCCGCNGCSNNWNWWNNGWNGWNWWNNGCNCDCSSDWSNGNSRSGDIRLITVCGNSGNTDNSRQSRNSDNDTTRASDNGDDYYARQYGLNGRSGRSSCGCGCND